MWRRMYCVNLGFTIINSHVTLTCAAMNMLLCFYGVVRTSGSIISGIDNSERNGAAALVSMHMVSQK